MSASLCDLFKVMRKWLLQKEPLAGVFILIPRYLFVNIILSDVQRALYRSGNVFIICNYRQRRRKWCVTQ